MIGAIAAGLISIPVISPNFTVDFLVLAGGGGGGVPIRATVTQEDVLRASDIQASCGDVLVE